jgi:hypothetical protein
MTALSEFKELCKNNEFIGVSREQLSFGVDIQLYHYKNKLIMEFESDNDFNLYKLITGFNRKPRIEIKICGKK